MNKTHRSPDNAYAGQGAVRQSGGDLPIYVCETCGADVVWATSTRTGRRYLANVCRNYNGARYYVAARLHGPACEATMQRRFEYELKDERDHATLYLLWEMDDHENNGHPTPIAGCEFCARGVGDVKAAREAHIREILG